MGRTIFYFLLILSFCLGVFFKQFSLFYPKPFVIIAFSGAIGLLFDYASRIRHSWWVLVPAILGAEVLGDLLYNAQLRSISFYIYFIGASLYAVYGTLFIRSAIQIYTGRRLKPVGGEAPDPAWHAQNRNLAWKFIILGILAIIMTSWEVATYFPSKWNTSGMFFKVSYLATFAWLLFIDFSSKNLAERGFKIEQQILRVSLLVISMMYFVRFIFK